MGPKKKKANSTKPNASINQSEITEKNCSHQVRNERTFVVSDITNYQSNISIQSLLQASMTQLKIVVKLKLHS